MIVRQEWADDGDVYWKRSSVIRWSQGESLQYHRTVPAFLWRAYVAARALVDVLSARIDRCPELPEYVSYREERDRQAEKRAKFEREANARHARDRALQEEIRRAGALAPLLKDCPTDEPVRIG